VLRALTPVAGAVPPGSTVLHSTRHDAVWSRACRDNPGGRAGWSGVLVLTVFQSTGASPAVVETVGTELAPRGWSRSRPVPDAAWQYDPVAEWSKAVPGTTSARVVLFPYPPGDGPPTSTPGTVWMLGAEGKTPGYALPGC
jgi:hypothetical protein